MPNLVQIGKGDLHQSPTNVKIWLNLLHMPFALWVRMGPRNQKLHGIQIPIVRVIFGKGGAHCKV